MHAKLFFFLTDCSGLLLYQVFDIYPDLILHIQGTSLSNVKLINYVHIINKSGKLQCIWYLIFNGV